MHRLAVIATLDLGSMSCLPRAFIVNTRSANIAPQYSSRVCLPEVIHEVAGCEDPTGEPLSLLVIVGLPWFFNIGLGSL